MSIRFIVPDACALGAAFFRERHSAHAEPLLAAIRRRDVDAIAPVQLAGEFLNICRKKREGATPISAETIDSIISDFLSLPIVWDPEPIEIAADAAWRLYQPGGVQPLDAFFLDTAMRWQAELWTADQGLYGRAKPLYARVFNLCTIPFR